MKFQVTTYFAGLTTKTVVTAEDYNYDSDGLNLVGTDEQNVASFNFSAWVSIEQVPD